MLVSKRRAKRLVGQSSWPRIRGCATLPYQHGKQSRCCVVAGRLLEVDVGTGYRTVSDVDRMIAMMAEQIGRIAEPSRVVIAGDRRACRLFTQDVSTHVVEMLERANPRVERSGILLDPESATLVLQLQRLAREAHLDVRRIFTDASAMEIWLGEVLTAEERARLWMLLHSTLRRSVQTLHATSARSRATRSKCP
jgi:hypothetical protein